MTEQLADDALREKGLDALERELGRVQALRFLAMISREAFDYQRWRREHFGAMSLSELLRQIQSVNP